eukprot:929058-Rhodomonas_salina.2
MAEELRFEREAQPHGQGCWISVTADLQTGDPLAGTLDDRHGTGALVLRRGREPAMLEVSLDQLRSWMTHTAGNQSSSARNSKLDASGSESAGATCQGQWQTAPRIAPVPLDPDQHWQRRCRASSHAV